MAGIRIQNIPSSVTEKQLKVYFSNPKHGGGPVKQLLFPMPCGSAVVIYEDSKDAQQILLKRHKVGEEKLTIRTLPRQIFRLASVEVDKRVSEFISRKPDMVDELQFVAELAVDFSYEREAYVMSGAWYQLEWAMQYLDNMLDVYEFDKQNPAAEADNPLDSMEGFRPPLEIKQPNIPSMPVEEPTQAHEENIPSRPSPFAADGYLDSISASKPAKKKNKNVVPHKPGETIKADQPPAEFDPNFGSRLQRNKPPVTGRRDNVAGWFPDEGGDMAGAFSFLAKNQNVLGVDTMGYPGRHRKNVQFDSTTDFSAKPRPTVPRMPRKTKGIDVYMTDFGNMPMSLVLTTPCCLTVHVTKDDITRQSTECIVNSTNQDLTNTYGSSRAIVKAVGQKLQIECLNYVHNNGYLNVTQVMHTAAGGNMDPRVKFILHTAGPAWHESTSEEATHALVCTYINCLQYADMKLQLRSIAMPLISAGAFGFPLDVCSQAFYDAILLVTSSSSTPNSLKEVDLVCYDEDTTMAVIMILQSLQDCDITQATQVAIDRYKSNLSQNGVGADNFLASFTIPEAKPVVKKQKNIQPEVHEAVEVPKQVKLDDKSDNESEQEETVEGAEEELKVAYRDLSESESDNEYKPDEDVEQVPYRKVEAFEAAASELIEDEEYVDNASQARQYEESLFRKKSKNEKPGFSASFQEKERDTDNLARFKDKSWDRERDTDNLASFKDKSRDRERDTDNLASFKDMSLNQPVQATAEEEEEELAGGYQEMENRDKDLENFSDTDSEDEKDYTEREPEPSEESLPELDAESTDEVVAQMSSILQKVQPDADDTADTSLSDRDSDVGVRAEASRLDMREVSDLSECDSVGGSMVKMDRDDVDDVRD